MAQDLNLVVTVKKLEVEKFSPPLKGFQVEVQNSNNNGSWEESFGDQEKLNSFLRGMTAAGSMFGHMLTGLSWNDPPTWSGPCGRRWIFKNNELPKVEELDERGNVIEI